MQYDIWLTPFDVELRTRAPLSFVPSELPTRYLALRMPTHEQCIAYAAYVCMHTPTAAHLPLARLRILMKTKSRKVSKEDPTGSVRRQDDRGPDGADRHGVWPPLLLEGDPKCTSQ